LTTNSLFNIAIELAILSLLGMVYYFYQKRKLAHFEKNKTLISMNLILDMCLSRKSDSASPQLDLLIEALDDFITQKTEQPPLELIQTYLKSEECSPDLYREITTTLREFE
jgi:hypothetical protein